MRKKIIFNVLLNLVLILSIFGIGWAYKNQSPLIVVFLVAVFVTAAYYKYQLLKEVRQGFKK